MEYIIGVDFDNTIVCYDNLMHRVAVEQGLINPDTERSKKHIRDRIRELPNGELRWQSLQAIVYGQRIVEAELINGVQNFFELCKKNRSRVYIISHKTEYVDLGDNRLNLRMAALDWMMEKKILDPEGIGLSQKDVYFESTRHEKIECIKYLGCTHYIDDLEETFLQDSFPTNVEKVLYAPHMDHPALQGIRTFTTWEEISDYFFAARN